MKKILGNMAIAACMVSVSPVAKAVDPLDFVFVTHAIAGQPFWLTVKLGMDELAKWLRPSVRFCGSKHAEI